MNIQKVNNWERTGGLIFRWASWIKVEKEKGFLGDDLLSQEVALQVPSALTGLTAGFGMEPGVPPPLGSPRKPVFT